MVFTKTRSNGGEDVDGREGKGGSSAAWEMWRGEVIAFRVAKALVRREGGRRSSRCAAAH